MELKRRIKLSPVVAFRRSEKNPYMYGLHMRRDLTVKEACHIYRNIFLFNIDLSLNESDADEKKKNTIPQLPKR